ncbi:hypothetical protein L6452_22254 [Arctium lappa]|uniref:Uncharacterized protein n=1 Tax=Arctium lappa TaxID=4217 RepID=A0ACB9AYW9_ARCLA|nr:hypothetical protein L6452_22254 [Arctium lappa]
MAFANLHESCSRVTNRVPDLTHSPEFLCQLHTLTGIRCRLHALTGIRCRLHALTSQDSRGCGNSPVTTPQFHSASFLGDIGEVVAHVSSRYPDANLYAAGWSLGANILVRYLAQESDSCLLSDLAVPALRKRSSAMLLSLVTLHIFDRGILGGGLAMKAVFEPWSAAVSNTSIQPRSLNNVLGNLDSFCVKPYEMFEEEERQKLHWFVPFLADKGSAQVLRSYSSNHFRFQVDGCSNWLYSDIRVDDGQADYAIHGCEPWLDDATSDLVTS